MQLLFGRKTYQLVIESCTRTRRQLLQRSRTAWCHAVSLMDFSLSRGGFNEREQGVNDDDAEDDGVPGGAPVAEGDDGDYLSASTVTL